MPSSDDAPLGRYAPRTKRHSNDAPLGRLARGTRRPRGFFGPKMALAIARAI
jgi:hypothetical protein